ncbi:MAG: ArgE/DapE family deacylase [Actinobacteria bacterium]|nr:ArgE/DapE family deacylase [Actinomycetota bacterium]
MAGMLSDIIRIDTSVPPGRNYPEMADYLEPLLEQAGLRTERVVVPEEEWRKIPLPLEGERVNLVAAMDSGKPPVSIYAHMDVVPAGVGWTVEPFEGKVINGEVYGRGAVDMKGTIPPAVVALEVIGELGLEPRFDVRVLLCTDEEIGIDPGAAYLARNGYFKPPIIHLEGGGQGPAMIAANAGSLKATVTTIGREVHSGFSFLGINALEEAIPVMQELMELKRRVEVRESSFPSLPLPGVTSEKLTPTFNLNIMTAGVKLNIVPGRAELQIDRRFLPEEKVEDAEEEIQSAVDKARAKSKAERIEVDFVTIYLPHSIDTSSPHVEHWNEGVRLALGLPADLEFIYPAITGSTDMSFVKEILKTDQFVGTGVVDLEHVGAHQADECVPIKNMVNLCKELVYFLVDLEVT